jgi:hypothetical protein
MTSSLRGDWSYGELGAFLNEIRGMSNKMGGIPVFQKVWAKSEIRRDADGKACPAGTAACVTKEDNVMHLWSASFARGVGTFAHEFAHIWDQRNRDSKNDGLLWQEMAKVTGSSWNDGSCDRPGCVKSPWNVGSGRNVPGSYAGSNPWEDWAMSVELLFSSKPFGDTYTPSQYGVRMNFVMKKIYEVRSQVY